MIIRLILALAIIFGIYWFVRKSLKSAKTKEERRSISFQLACWGVALFLLIAVLTGKLHWLGAVFAAVLALAKFGLTAMMRALPFLGFLKKHQVFGNPVFRTEFVEVKLDLKNNKLSGQVISGPHEGRELTSLSLEELKELEAYYQDKDKRSYYLIRVLIQQGGAKYEEQSQQHFATVGDPSIDEAKLILGLENSPTRDDIIKAHRSLIQKLHPDRGGNDYLASRVNVAKEVLLKQFDKK